MKTLAQFVPLLALGASFAGSPLSTVPWNGHRGAVSFTFDDGIGSQIKHVLPALEKRGIRATFFLVGNGIGSNRDTWIQAARAGHELGNHTLTHASLGGLDSAGVEKEISGMADTLRALDSSVQAVTLAYPYCATSDLIDRIADRQNIVARTCGWYARFAWNEIPAKWMEATSFIVTDSATSREALTEIDRADSAGTWMVTLHHAIEENDGYAPIPLKDAEAMFDRAIARNLWIATYQDVAAYWRASKVLDTARATASGAGWTIAWTSPHKRMPRAVPLRVKLDTATFGTTSTVSQDGRTLAPESDGSYVIDFMKLSLQVSRTVRATPRRPSPSAQVRSRGASLEVVGLDGGVWRWELRSTDGSLLRSEQVFVAKDARLAIPAGTAAVGLLRLHSETGSVIDLRTLPKL